MTTIVWRDGIMASDSGSWTGDASHGWARKLSRGSDGTLYGVSGDAAACNEFLEWVDAGCVEPKPKPEWVEKNDGNTFIVLIARPGQRIGIWTSRGEERYHAPYYAIGAGASTAFGALFMGATAEQAIEATKEHGAGAFGKVQMISNRPMLEQVA